MWPIWITTRSVNVREVSLVINRWRLERILKSASGPEIGNGGR